MNGRLELIVWDVQHGNAIYMNTPNGTTVFFDIGNGSYGGGQTFSPLKYLKHKGGVKKIDYLVISHPHADHISDIKTMFDEELKPRVLNRPKGLEEEFIRTSNQDEFEELMDLYLKLDKTYTLPVPDEENPAKPDNNGGVIISTHSQKEKGNDNLNNYSVVSIAEFENEKIIIPGDIESVGWKALLEKENFKNAIKNATLLVASHHGREAGFCKEIFDYFKPDAIIISDGRFSDTSASDRYYHYSKGTKVKSRSTNEEKERFVLTTRKDEAIYIGIEDNNRIITIK